MFEEIISSMTNFVDLIVPSDEDLNIIIKKLDNNEELDFYDLLVIDRVRMINHLLKNKGDRI